jgi:hypothetical protein
MERGCGGKAKSRRSSNYATNSAACGVFITNPNSAGHIGEGLISGFRRWKVARARFAFLAGIILRGAE